MFKIRLTGGKLTAEDWLKAIIAGILSLGLFASVDAQNSDPWSGHIVRKDTVVSNAVSVMEYTNRQGKLDYKAQWSGRAINISNKDGNAILEGDDACIILVTYNIEGREVIMPKKIIARKLRNNQ